MVICRKWYIWYPVRAEHRLPATYVYLKYWLPMWQHCLTLTGQQWPLLQIQANSIYDNSLCSKNRNRPTITRLCFNSMPSYNLFSTLRIQEWLQQSYLLQQPLFNQKVIQYLLVFHPTINQLKTCLTSLGWNAIFNKSCVLFVFNV